MTDTVRASSLPGYSDCPRRAASRLFRREIEGAGYSLRQLPQGIGASIGSAVHAGAAYTLTEKMQTGSPAPLSAVTDRAIHEYDERTADGVTFDKETPARNVAEKQILRMTSAYQGALVPHIEPIAVEEPLEADTPFGIVLTGHTDLLAREPGRLSDLKTGKRRSNYKAQVGAYSLLLKAAGYDVTECSEDFLQRVAITKPQPDPVRHAHELESAEVAAWAVVRQVARDLRVFREGDRETHTLPGDAWAWNANPSSMLCSEKWCPAHGTPFCREWMAKE